MSEMHEPTSLPVYAPAPRRKLRTGVVAGFAAVLLAGGGLTAVAMASGPEAGVAAVAPTTDPSVPAAPTAPAAPTDGATPPTGAPTPGDDATRPARSPHLHGTVTAVSGSTVTIKDRDGFTRTINVTDDTTYADGLTAALAVGTEITASGTVNPDGTSLDATTIGAGKGPGDGGRMGHGGPGKGGFGGGQRPAPGAAEDGSAPDGSLVPPTPGSPAPSTQAPTTS